MNPDLNKILFKPDVIQKRIEQIGQSITQDLKGHPLVVVCVLKGSVMFFSDLVRAIKLPVEMAFIKVSSYGSKSKSGKLQQCEGFSENVAGKNVLIVEDIIDTGKTLQYLMTHFKEKGALSIKTITLLDKPSRRIIDIKADYTCFEVPDQFVVGYGLDYNQKYRNLPYVAELKEECYAD